MSEETKEQTSEAENTQVKETISDSTGDVNEEMSSDNEHKVLPYPDRVPNVHKGTTYKPVSYTHLTLPTKRIV